MTQQWNDRQPIYRQLEERLIDSIVKGAFPEGEAVPSVRQLSTDFQLNHLTVSRAYQDLVDSGILEKRRGLGMFVVEGARKKLIDMERDKFLQQEFPAFISRMKQLGISLEELITMIKKQNGDTNR